MQYSREKRVFVTNKRLRIAGSSALFRKGEDWRPFCWNVLETRQAILLEPAKKERSWLSGHCWHFTTEACESAGCRGNTHGCPLQPAEGSRASRSPHAACHSLSSYPAHSQFVESSQHSYKAGISIFTWQTRNWVTGNIKPLDQGHSRPVSRKTGFQI